MLCFKAKIGHINEGRTIFTTNGAGMSGYPHEKNEVGPLPHTTLKNEPKMHHRVYITVMIVNKNISYT